MEIEFEFEFEKIEVPKGIKKILVGRVVLCYFILCDVLLCCVCSFMLCYVLLCCVCSSVLCVLCCVIQCCVRVALLDIDFSYPIRERERVILPSFFISSFPSVFLFVFLSFFLSSPHSFLL